jgi:exosome complex component RRP45
MIYKILKQSRAVDKEGLCIVSGRIVWSVQINIFLLNEDGNLMDACFLLTILALMNTKVPEVAVSKDKIKVDYEKVRYLNVHHVPVCSTFYYLEDVEKPVIDANGKEEKLAIAKLSIVTNIFSDLCGMTTFGCLEVGPNDIKTCISIAA